MSASKPRKQEYVSDEYSDLHAHFDCFSGAAGDMMLASCLDSSNNPQKLLDQIENDLKNGIPEIRDEFSLKVEKVWRGGMGSIAALKVTVESIYNHEAAPVPSDDHNLNHEHEHEHEDSKGSSHEEKDGHDHSHGHGHSHENEYEHSHGQANSLSHKHEHAHEHAHEHSHEHSHEHTHEHTHDQSHAPLRNLPQIKSMLQSASNKYIPKKVSDLAIQTFTELAIAEAFTHGTSSANTVHFHEVGAIDSIVDIIGTLLALEYLSVSTVSCSRLPISEGSVWTDHGQLPVPAFATMRLLIGMKTCKGPGENNGTITGELVTPTAAALLRVLSGVADFENEKKKKQDGGKAGSSISVRVGRPPIFTPRAVGIGAGTKDFIKHPNVMRLILGNETILDDGKIKQQKSGIPLDDYEEVVESKGNESLTPLETTIVEDKSTEQTHNQSKEMSASHEEDDALQKPWNTDRLTLLQTNIDDITSETLSYVMDLLLKNGAIDVWVESIVMKKGRSAHQLNCLLHSCESDSNDHNNMFTSLMTIIFQHTTTLGVRIQRDIERASLRRKIVQIQTIYGANDKAARNGVVDVKLGLLNNKAVSVKAEFDHCKLISEKAGIPIKLIADFATNQARKQLQSMNKCDGVS